MDSASHVHVSKDLAPIVDDSEAGARSASNWTVVAPVACALHCATTPLLALALPFAVSTPAVEWGFLGATVLAGGIVLPKEMPRMSKARLPLILLGLGVALWVASLLRLFDPLPHEWTTVPASLAAGVGLFSLARSHRQDHAAAG